MGVGGEKGGLGDSPLPCWRMLGSTPPGGAAAADPMQPSVTGAGSPGMAAPALRGGGVRGTTWWWGGVRAVGPWQAEAGKW